ncbi:MAG: diguanylate cyclase with sensor [Herbinix sp.]|jgi:putative methionine-R-sulfoxide reductase with GAF domain|nr:diguanylate cyclase with sensor [Herbinix sp.]
MNQENVSKDKLLEIINVQTEVVQLGMDLSSIMELVTQRSQHITNADGASIELIEQKELVYRAVSGIADMFLGLRLNIENSLSGECIRKREPLISNDIEKDDRVNKAACRKIGLNSMIVVPLICKDDVVGIMKVLSKKADHFMRKTLKHWS